MLNPRWYTEDGQRILACKPLAELGQVFGKELPRLASLLDSPAAEARVNAFYTRVGLPFDPIQSTSVSHSKTILCPRCRAKIIVPYMKSDGTGYLQSRFRVSCPRDSCPVITKGTLCARKLAENLSRQGMAPDSYLPYVVSQSFDVILKFSLFSFTQFSSYHTTSFFHSGTFFTESRVADQKAGRLLISDVAQRYDAALPGSSTGNQIVTTMNVTATSNYNNSQIATEATVGCNEVLCLKILHGADYKLAEIRGQFKMNKLIGRVMSAHSTPMIYSVELSGALSPLGNRQDMLAATHASEHNAVLFACRNRRTFDTAKIRHKEHAKKMERRVKRAEKGKSEKGFKASDSLPKEDGSEQEMSKEGRDKRERETKENNASYCGYGAAFLMPVPLVYSSGGSLNGGAVGERAIQAGAGTPGAEGDVLVLVAGGQEEVGVEEGEGVAEDAEDEKLIASSISNCPAYRTTAMNRVSVEDGIWFNQVVCDLISICILCGEGATLLPAIRAGNPLNGSVKAKEVLIGTADAKNEGDEVTGALVDIDGVLGTTTVKVDKASTIFRDDEDSNESTVGLSNKHLPEDEVN
ncbi:hypothetical protein H1R20_g15173, partial [Candolleomyces eurysporus]